MKRSIMVLRVKNAKRNTRKNYGKNKEKKIKDAAGEKEPK